MDETLDLRIQKTRKNFVEALLSILQNQHPNKKIKVVNICKEAKITYQTFYSHFHNKIELMKYVVKSQLEYIFPIPVKIKTTNLRNLSKYLLDFLVSFCFENKKLILNCVQIANYQGYRNSYLDVLLTTIKYYFHLELSGIYKNLNTHIVEFWTETVANSLFNTLIHQTIQNKQIDKSILFNNLMVMVKLF